MPVTIASVEDGSPASKCGVQPGDLLLSINGYEIEDVLDFRFYMTERKLKLSLLRGGSMLSLTLHKKEEYDETGMGFDTYLMDRQRACKNKCIFCFIDQLPKGLRKSLYFKDDDSRLSFLFGNYITLTNLTEHEISRIIKMHISPVNISVHTTNPDLRCRMMKNKNAGKALDAMYRFAQAGIKMNTQLVLCPGWNDGQELKNSLEELGSLYPSIQSIAAVPVGLTRYREGLEPLVPFDRNSAGAVIDIMEQFGSRFYEKHGTRLCFPADEFYLKAEREIPDSAFYEDFAQIENGVGMWASTRDDFLSALSDAEPDDKKRSFCIATGEAAAPLIEMLMQKAAEKFSGLTYRIYPVKNEFFGGHITVSGLLTGQDILAQLSGKDLYGRVLLPSSCVRRERDLFLDDTTVDGLQTALGVPVEFTENDGYAFFEQILSF